MPRKSRQPFRNGKVHVKAEMCATCIFRPGNLMRLEPGRVKKMVARTLKRESAIHCHETLDGDKAICRGFYDKFPTQPLQIAQRLGYIKEVP